MPERPSVDRLEVVRVLAAELDPDPSHAEHVTGLALQVFDQTADLHGYGAHERELLTAAGLLHDIGWSVSADGASHHKHARDLIIERHLPGFSDIEALIVALVARYHRKAVPKSRHVHFAELAEDERQRVRVLAGILRIADGLDRSHYDVIEAIHVTIADNEVVLHLAASDDPDTELWAAGRKKDLFEDTFGRPVRFEVVEPAGPGEREA